MAGGAPDARLEIVFDEALRAVTHEQAMLEPAGAYVPRWVILAAVALAVLVAIGCGLGVPALLLTR